MTKIGENQSINTGDIAETYSLRRTKALKHGQMRSKHIAFGDYFIGGGGLKINYDLIDR